MWPFKKKAKETSETDGEVKSGRSYGDPYIELD